MIIPEGESSTIPPPTLLCEPKSHLMLVTSASLFLKGGVGGDERSSVM